MTTNRPLRVFLCHSSADKPAVRELYQKLRAEPWIEPWLDEENLFPGMDWNMEIEKAIESTDVILVCLSNNSITKEGYVQREIRIALDYADYKPEGALFIIPVRLEECTPPKRLARWQYADYFEGQGVRALQRLLISLEKRAESLNLDFEKSKINFNEAMNVANQLINYMNVDSNVEEPSFSDVVSFVEDLSEIILPNGLEFMRVPAGEFLMGSENGDSDERPQHIVNISYDYWLSRYPITNELYNAFVIAKGVEHPVADWENKKEHPVVYVSWNESIEYCWWLNNLLKGKLPLDLVLRLPTEAEWEKAARGFQGREYPWGDFFDKNNCNTDEGGKKGTTRVGLYSPQGDSLFKCADMSGNVWEWTCSLYKPYPYNIVNEVEKIKESELVVLHGGSWMDDQILARASDRDGDFPDKCMRDTGFRICLAPPLTK